MGARIVKVVDAGLQPVSIYDRDTNEKVVLHYELACIVEEKPGKRVFYRKTIKRRWTNLSLEQWEQIPEGVRQMLGRKGFRPVEFVSDEEIEAYNRSCAEESEARRAGMTARILADAFPGK